MLVDERACLKEKQVAVLFLFNTQATVMCLPFSKKSTAHFPQSVCASPIYSYPEMQESEKLRLSTEMDMTLIEENKEEDLQKFIIGVMGFLFAG